MSKKFQYNFTNENQLIQLKERIAELEEENNLLKHSLEELIKVNTELTQSIEEFNSDNIQQQYQTQQIQEMHNTIEQLNGQIERLRRDNEISIVEKQKNSKRGAETSIMDEKETESLVNVLEELIESFKNMQNRYEQEIQDLKNSCQQYKQSYEQSLVKLEDEYKQKLNTLEPIILQLNRKDQNLGYIEERLYELERRKEDIRQNGTNNINYAKNTEQMRQLQEALEEKNRIIKFYQGIMDKLKIKFSQKI